MRTNLGGTAVLWFLFGILRPEEEFSCATNQATGTTDAEY